MLSAKGVLNRANPKYRNAANLAKGRNARAPSVNLGRSTGATHNHAESGCDLWPKPQFRGLGETEQNGAASGARCDLQIAEITHRAFNPIRHAKRTDRSSKHANDSMPIFGNEARAFTLRAEKQRVVFAMGDAKRSSWS